MTILYIKNRPSLVQRKDNDVCIFALEERPFKLTEVNAWPPVLPGASWFKNQPAIGREIWSSLYVLLSYTSFFRCLSSLYLTSLPSLSYVCPFPYPSLTFTSVRHTFIAGLASSYRYACLYERTYNGVCRSRFAPRGTRKIIGSLIFGAFFHRVNVQCTCIFSLEIMKLMLIKLFSKFVIIRERREECEIICIFGLRVDTQDRCVGWCNYVVN